MKMQAVSYHCRFVLFFLLPFLFAGCKLLPRNQQAPEAAVDPKIASLKIPAGFHADHLYSPGVNDQGSWVAMTFDEKGRMITSDQYGNLYRLIIPAVGSDTNQKIKVEKIEIQNPVDTSAKARKIGYAQGLLYAFHSLFVMVNDEGDTVHSRRSGLYRLFDTNGDDQYDSLVLLKRLDGEGEHGPHSIVLSPDGKSLYIIAGNFTKIPKMDRYTMVPDWQIDNLLPFLKDPNGHDNTVNTHGGWIARIAPDGSDFELISAGFRNPFDLAFNESGDLFTFDSDMEWDFGLPWYRPIRICHVPEGADFGWRPGTEKWSPDYADNLPALLNIGQGSPTSVFNGLSSRFPDKYRKSLFAFDWSFGIIYAFQLQPAGATYKATAEEFVSGSPLPLTDGQIGPDGALYFLTGGRRLQSDLYRVYYGDNSPIAPIPPTPALNEIQQLRRTLENVTGESRPDALAIAWPQLGNADRYIRYAARMAVEKLPVTGWQDKALKETDPVIFINAAMALAKTGKPEIRDQLLVLLSRIPVGKLTQDQDLDLLRSIELVLLRMGKPGASARAALVQSLNAQYPAPTNKLNRELSKILLYLDDPQALEKTISLFETAKDDTTEQQGITKSSDQILRNVQYGADIAATLSSKPPEQQIYYALVLSGAKSGWTEAGRQKYFSWYAKALSFKGGHSFTGYIDLMRKNALKQIPKDKYSYYNTLSGDSLVNQSALSISGSNQHPVGPGRDWSIDSAMELVKNGLSNRNFVRGKAMYIACLCSVCHTKGDFGGSIGPDLTQLGTRFSYHDMLEAIIEPSKSISDQFAATIIYLKDGSSVVGRIINQDNDKYYISQNPFAPQQLREINKKDVTGTRLSKESIMFKDLINRLNPEELKDLLAYLRSNGNATDTIFSKK